MNDAGTLMPGAVNEESNERREDSGDASGHRHFHGIFASHSIRQPPSAVNLDPGGRPSTWIPPVVDGNG